jgi:hypothetical protein
LIGAKQAHRVQSLAIVESDETQAFMSKAVPSPALRALAKPFQVHLAVAGCDTYLHNQPVAKLLYSIGPPIREHPAAFLPGLANRSIHSLEQLTPAAYAASKLK